MKQQSASGTQGGGFGAGVLNEMLMAGRLVFDSRVPASLKLMLPAAALLYWIWPIDLLPGLPFDDIAVLVIALHFFVKLANEALDKQQPQGPQSTQPDDGTVVDTTWRVVD